MSFKVGKYYKHSGNGMMHIVGSVKSTMYGWTLVAEEAGSSHFQPVGQYGDNSVNWTETTKEEWMKNFS